MEEKQDKSEEEKEEAEDEDKDMKTDYGEGINDTTEILRVDNI